MDGWQLFIVHSFILKSLYQDKYENLSDLLFVLCDFASVAEEDPKNITWNYGV